MRLPIDPRPQGVWMWGNIGHSELTTLSPVSWPAGGRTRALKTCHRVCQVGGEGDPAVAGHAAAAHHACLNGPQQPLIVLSMWAPRIGLQAWEPLGGTADTSTGGARCRRVLCRSTMRTSSGCMAKYAAGFFRRSGSLVPRLSQEPLAIRAHIANISPPSADSSPPMTTESARRRCIVQVIWHLERRQ